MKLIVGLGNPGEKYERTRHNAGWQVLDFVAHKFGSENWEDKKKFKANIIEAHYAKGKIILAKPQTFMNLSGEAVSALLEYYHIPVESLLVIHDEIDLPIGEIRMQQKRGSAGHKGVQSIIDLAKSNDFYRLRIGIRPKEEVDCEKFVLGKFTESEQELLNKVIKESFSLIEKEFLEIK